MKYISLTAHFLALPLLTLAQQQAFSNGFGNGISLDGAKNFIRESTTTMVLPALNSPMGSGFLKIYPALYTNATASLSGTALTVNDPTFVPLLPPTVIETDVASQLAVSGQPRPVVCGCAYGGGQSTELGQIRARCSWHECGCSS
jgi:hypothetical protein